jgi:hypothetical protein
MRILGSSDSIRNAAWHFRTSSVGRTVYQVWENAKLKTRIVTAVLALSVGSGPVFAASQTSSFQFLGKPGPYRVGLKVFDQYDHSLTFVPPTEGPSESSVGKNARPLQTLIWYPSLMSVGGPMTVEGGREAGRACLAGVATRPGRFFATAFLRKGRSVTSIHNSHQRRGNHDPGIWYQIGHVESIRTARSRSEGSLKKS